MFSLIGSLHPRYFRSTTIPKKNFVPGTRYKLSATGLGVLDSNVYTFSRDVRDKILTKRVADGYLDGHCSIGGYVVCVCAFDPL